jgi:hypothetical protein
MPTGNPGPGHHPVLRLQLKTDGSEHETASLPAWNKKARRQETKRHSGLNCTNDRHLADYLCKATDTQTYGSL